jgi:calcineurin-like phosphoesterase family protein
MSDLFFTADWHLGHRNIIEFCKRPFANVDEMTEVLIEKHNKKVPRSARVVYIGDMFWRTFGVGNALGVMNRLNGEPYFVYGNHDELIEENPELRSRFRFTENIAEIKCKPLPKIVCCHYAMRVWPGSHRGSWHLYGHSHGELPENDSMSFDVGVDCWNFEPVSIDEVAIKMLPKMKTMAKLDKARKDFMSEFRKAA